MSAPALVLPVPYEGPLLPYHPDARDPPRPRWVKRWLKLTRRFARTIDFQSLHGPMRGLRGDLTITAKYLRTGQWHGALDSLFAALSRSTPFDLLINIGANNGCTALPVIKHGFAKRVIAIEPEPDNLAVLAHNIARNHLGAHIAVAPYAVGAEDSELSFETSPTNTGDHRLAGDAPLLKNWRLVQVPVRRLDDAILPALTDVDPGRTLIWMDIQGAEPLAIAGGRALLKRFPLTIVEFNPAHMQRLGATRDGVTALYGAIWQRMKIAEDGGWREAAIGELPDLWDRLIAKKGGETDLILRA